jgi:hypothetical protein
VRPVALPQAELSLEVLVEKSLLLDRLQQGLVHLLLVLRPLAADLLLLRLALGEESLLRTLLVRLLVALEVLGASSLVHGGLVDAVEGHGGLGRDHVAGVDAAERDAIDLEGTGNQKHALVEDFEEDNALAPEAASEQNEDLAGLQRGAGLVGTEGLADLCVIILVFNGYSRCGLGESLGALLEAVVLYLLGLRLVLGGVVFAGLLGRGRNGPLAALELLGLGLLRRHGGRLCWCRSQQCQLPMVGVVRLRTEEGVLLEG